MWQFELNLLVDSLDAIDVVADIHYYLLLVAFDHLETAGLEPLGFDLVVHLGFVVGQVFAEGTVFYEFDGDFAVFVIVAAHLVDEGDVGASELQAISD